LVIEDDGQATVVGELAHIVAKSVQGPRGHLDIDPNDREAPGNYTAFCRPHHKVVDANPLKYSVTVLRAMKEGREKEQSCADDAFAQLPRAKELLHSSMLWVQALPSQLFSAPTNFEFEAILERMQPCADVTPFVLSGGRLWTFHDLSDNHGPFAKAVDRRSIESLPVNIVWSDPDFQRRYVALLNRALTQHLGRKGLRYDKNHRRHYFTAPQPAAPVERTYKTKSGRSQRRLVVRRAKFKDGTLKDLWWHLAVRMRFEQVTAKSWYMTIRPEFHLTKDGHEPLESQRIGRRVTRAKSTIYNEGYLNLVHFWRAALSNEKPRTVIRAGQLIVIDSHLVDASITWPGVPDDQIEFSPDPFPENLFTIAEINDLSDEQELDFWDEEDEEG
jgi:hypothetical protein